MFLYLSIVSFCVMCFQAINKGPSRLPGSRVDIRIPNRLTGNGAEMFHIIETQVDASSSPSTLFIQTKLLFISLFTCRKPHFLLIYPAKAYQSCLFCSSWHSCLYPLQRILLCTESCYTAGFLFRTWAVCLVWGTTGPVKVEAKMLTLLLKLAAHFVSQHFAF